MSVLPENINEAMRRMIDITGELLQLTEDEAFAINTKDVDALKTTQGRKADLAATYEKAAAEFAARALEFKDADAALVQELADVQNALKSAALHNQTLYEGAQKDAS